MQELKPSNQEKAGDGHGEEEDESSYCLEMRALI